MHKSQLRLGNCDASGTVFEEGCELVRIARGREAGLARADDGERLVGRQMRKRFFEGAGEMELWSVRSDAQDGFAEAVDAVSSGFKSLGGGIIRIASDDNLNGMTGEERGSKAVSGGKEAVLWTNAGESFEGFLSERIMAIIARERMHSNERDGGGRIGSRRGGILERLAAHVEATHGCGIGGTIQETAVLGVAVASDGEIHGFLRGIEIACIKRGFVGVD